MANETPCPACGSAGDVTCEECRATAERAEASGPCGQCIISGSDCDHCGPPAWEGFVGTADSEGGIKE